MEVKYRGLKYKDTYRIEALVGDEIAGTLLFRYTKTGGYIWVALLKVTGNCRNMGIGSALLQLLENTAKKHGISMLEGKLPLHKEARERARAFYQANGCQVYEDHGEEKFVKFVNKDLTLQPKITRKQKWGGSMDITHKIEDIEFIEK